MASRSDKEKAAVLAALLAGSGTAAASIATGVPERTIRNWIVGDSKFADVKTLQNERFEQAVLDYLESGLTALSAQVKITSTKEYLERQPAGEIAILHGVIADKMFRLLDALATRERRSVHGQGESPAEND